MCAATSRAAIGRGWGGNRNLGVDDARPRRQPWPTPVSLSRRYARAVIAKRTLIAAVALVLGGCAAATVAPTTAPSLLTTITPAATTPPTTAAFVTTTTVPVTTTTASPFARPAWLGTRVLPLGPDGENGIPQPTPPELQDRRLETIDLLPPPPDDQFVSTIGPVPDDVIARSTWTEECPVTRDELAYITVSHYGFDGRLHTGEMLVNAAVADDIVGVFEKLHAARFPIEGMKVTTQAELDAPPTGDGNNTGSFGCRPAVGSGHWSQHAYGLAVDVNPFHNPYIKGDLIIPELATSYTNRDRVLPGMIFENDVVFDAFAAIGWTWGGDWHSLKDYMHFSQNGH